MTIKAVFFDMGGTIQNYWPSPDCGLKAVPDIQNLLSSVGIDLGLNDQELYQFILDGVSRYHRWSLRSLSELQAHQIWGDFILAEHPEKVKEISAAADKIMVIVETRFFTREMRPEIPEVLEKIKQMGLKIGMISNVNNFGQVPQNLTEYDIKEYFNPIVLSAEFGRRKPDPAIFHQAARLAKVPTSACMHVGDRISRDILGAKNAGFQTAVQIKHIHEQGKDPNVAEPDFVIESMTELLDIVKEKLTAQEKKVFTSNGRLAPIRACLFDAGDVLYFRPNRNVKINSYLADQQVDLNDPVSKQELADLKLQAYFGTISHDAYLDRYLRLLGITQPEQIERGKQIIIDEKNDVDFFDGVRETLFQLKEMGYFLGIITDTSNNLHTKISWLEQGGIGKIWDSIISSRDIGARKPDPKMYLAALDQLGIGAEQAVFIGHKASELEGARAVGIKTIAFNYDKDVDADYYIESFLDLLNVPIIAP